MPPALVDDVRAALRHVHDPIFLQSSPLARSRTGAALARDLLDTIQALRPSGEPAPDAASRRFKLMLLRYVEGHDVDAVVRELSISRSQYYLDHRLALDAVVALLEERWAGQAPRGEVGGAGGAALPTELSSIVERERAIAEVVALLAEHRLLTLTGPPGAGKTRLAIAVGHAVAQLAADGADASTEVRFVPLAGVSEATQVVPSVAHALGAPESGGDSTATDLAVWLRGRRLLLVLDNFEHVALAAERLREVLGACPGLRLLVTSRVALRVPGEQVYPVPPLTTPDPGAPADAARFGAVRLFVERARAGRRDFVLSEANADAVGEICRRLGGLPLALELAAARARVLAPAEIVARLDDVLALLSRRDPHAAAHQQSLRAALDWSHALLAEPERLVLRRLSVFAGGATLEAVEQVCDVPDALDALAGLVDHSLIVVHDLGAASRYVLLEPIRQYAALRLREAGEVAATRDRHLAWFLAFSERELAAVLQHDHIQVMEREHGNVRVALRWAVDTGRAESGLRLLAANIATFHARGFRVEGREWFTQLSNLAGARDPSFARSRALVLVAQLAHDQGDPVGAATYLEEAASAADAVGDALGGAQAIHVLGHVAVWRGELEAADERYRRAAEEYARLDEGFWYLNALSHLAHVAERRDRPAEAAELVDQVLAFAPRGGGGAYVLGRLVPVRARLAARAGDHVGAGELYAAGLVDASALGDRVGALEILIDLGDLARARGAPAVAHRHYVDALGAAYEIGQRREVARCLEGLASVSTGAPARWLEIGAAAVAIRRACLAAPLPAERAAFERWREEAEAQLPPDECARAAARGAELSLSGAVEAALRDD